MEYKLFNLYEQITCVGHTMVELRDGSLVEVDKSLLPMGRRVVFLPLTGEDDGDYRWETGNVTGGNISYCEVLPGLTAFWATDPFKESVLAWRVAWHRNEAVDNCAATGQRLHHPDWGLDGCPGLTNAWHAVQSNTSYYEESRCWIRIFCTEKVADPNPRRKGYVKKRNHCLFQSKCQVCSGRERKNSRCNSG